MKFAVLIVTYNRKQLLAECLDCVMRQTLSFSRICVIDNCSTDGTGAYLDQLASAYSCEQTAPVLDIHHLEENLGGAGGFSFGLSILAETDCDWVLLIDDDAMIAENYIEELEKAIETTDYLAYSGSVTTGGRIDLIHRRILKNSLFMTYKAVPEDAYTSQTFAYDISTFCGLLLKTSLVREIGLPRAEYFIWFDDTEYCLRFNRRSRILNVNGAVLNHKTAPPEKAPAICWKSFYGFRNAIDIGRTYSSFPALYLLSIRLNHLAHILLDTIGLTLGSDPDTRRYRIQVYRDVLKGIGKKPDGADPRYLPGSSK